LPQVGRDVGIISYKSLSAVVSADEQSQTKECYLQFLKQNQAAVLGGTL